MLSATFPGEAKLDNPIRAAGKAARIWIGITVRQRSRKLRTSPAPRFRTMDVDPLAAAPGNAGAFEEGSPCLWGGPLSGFIDALAHEAGICARFSGVDRGTVDLFKRLAIPSEDSGEWSSSEREAREIVGSIRRRKAPKESSRREKGIREAGAEDRARSARCIRGGQSSNDSRRRQDVPAVVFGKPAKVGAAKSDRGGTGGREEASRKASAQDR